MSEPDLPPYWHKPNQLHITICPYCGAKHAGERNQYCFTCHRPINPVRNDLGDCQQGALVAELEDVTDYTEEIVDEMQAVPA